MDITVPVYIETAPGAAGKPPDYLVRPLYFATSEARSPFLESALNKLTHRLREMLVELGKVQRHDALAAWTFAPAVETKRCEVRIEVARQTARLKLLLVMMEKFDRKVAFTPAFPDVWFEILPDQIPEERLAEAITDHLRKLIKDGGEEQLQSLDRFSLKGNAWVSEIEFRLNPPRVREKNKDSLFALRGSAEVVDGESELYRVGRCLNHQYPHDLSRVMLRDWEVHELTRLLQAEDRRPVLLLGPRQVGKTAILHEYVFRCVRAVRNPHRDKQAVWLLSPQRLISGMSWVGQWETRFHAITKHAIARDLTLYFDDLPGLFHAGVTSQSTLSVASLLRTVQERRQVRIVAEITPGAFRVLREKDREFADAFHVIRVDELTGNANLQVLFGLQRQLEIRHRCRFEIDVLPTVIDLQRRYARDLAFPGKAAAFLKRLAVKIEGESEVTTSTHGRVVLRPDVSRDRVLDTFHHQSGLPRSFLDQQQTLSAEDVAAKLRERFVGQPDAVNAAVEIVSIARARLNDPSRPIASLLLLGPTGVGKTEFAKTLASYLFGNADRLVRFDMNEYVSPNAVPQLVGTFAHPEGFLTAAVRRQPFAVVLFDEIEKGHPDVFDLLLQVLGEGRLTDARGRTTDFSNTIIVLTSNLGTQRSESGLGFGSAGTREATASIRAAENFFRPEFFNRLDRVIPFTRLSRDDMQGIARHLMSDVLHRDGLVRRQCVLNTTPAALDWVIDQGYNPVLGARALKRSIEKELTRPIAAFLAANGASGRIECAPPGSEASESAASNTLDLMLIDVDRADHGLTVAVRSLKSQKRTTVEAVVPEEEVAAVLSQCRSMLEALSARVPELTAGRQFSTGRLSPEQTRYLLVQDELPRLRVWQEELQAELKARQHSSAGGAVPRSGKTGSGSLKMIRRRGPSHGNMVNRAAADDEIDDFFETRYDGAGRDVELSSETPGLLARCCWVQHVASLPVEQLESSVTLRICSLDPACVAYMERFALRLVEAWSDELGLEATCEAGAGGEPGIDSERGIGGEHSRTIRVKGVLADHYASVESGFHAMLVSGMPSPKLLAIHRVGEPVPEKIVRKLVVEDRESPKNWPTAEELRNFAWNALPRGDGTRSKGSAQSGC